MLTPDEAVMLASDLHSRQDRERQDLDVLRRYVTGRQSLPLVIPRDAPSEVREFARISRINLIGIVVNSLVESLYVDNLRVVEQARDVLGNPEGDPSDVSSKVWQAWQANKLDRAQSGLYRAVFTYGFGYAVYVQGKPFPVVRMMSPRKMTAVYGDDLDWPEFAIERRNREGTAFRLYDEEFVYTLGYDPDKKRFGVLGAPASHGSVHCPVVKYDDAQDFDLDDEPISNILVNSGPRRDETCWVAGQVAPLMTLQDQADVTSFGLLSAQWYTAFRQRWIVGWAPASRAEKLSSAASQLWAFEDSPEDVKLGEFGETTLEGFMRAREAVLKYGATLSQTPVHELIGELVNLSAEALAAAEAGRDRKIDERKTGLGESHEQLAQGVGDLMGVDVPDDLEVVWRDTSARAFGAIVDGLGKLSTMLQIPPAQLWDRIPGVTKQDVQRWKEAQKQGDSMAQLTGLLDKQAAPAPGPGLILPPGTGA